MKNLVSIIVNCFNGEKYLSKALNSLLNQKYKIFEVILLIIALLTLVQRYLNQSKIKDSIIIKQKKISLYASRNFALRKTKGKFVAFLDVDDWWNEDYLSSRKIFFYLQKFMVFHIQIVTTILRIEIISKFFIKKICHQDLYWMIY